MLLQDNCSRSWGEPRSIQKIRIWIRARLVCKPSHVQSLSFLLGVKVRMREGVHSPPAKIALSPRWCFRAIAKPTRLNAILKTDFYTPRIVLGIHTLDFILKTDHPIAADNHHAPLCPSWFCVRTQPRHGHIAASGLRRSLDLEVLLPRVRFKRQTRKGVARVTEALFLNYLFARLDWATCLRRV